MLKYIFFMHKIIGTKWNDGAEFYSRQCCRSFVIIRASRPDSPTHLLSNLLLIDTFYLHPLTHEHNSIVKQVTCLKVYHPVLMFTKTKVVKVLTYFWYNQILISQTAFNSYSALLHLGTCDINYSIILVQ